MSRIPGADCLKIAAHRRAVESFPDKVAALNQSQNMPPPMAALSRLHYQSVALIDYLGKLVDKGGNSMLIDAASIAIQHWNRTVRETDVLVTNEEIRSLVSRRLLRI